MSQLVFKNDKSEYHIGDVLRIDTSERFGHFWNSNLGIFMNDHGYDYCKITIEEVSFRQPTFMLGFQIKLSYVKDSRDVTDADYYKSQDPSFIPLPADDRVYYTVCRDLDFILYLFEKNPDVLR